MRFRTIALLVAGVWIVCRIIGIDLLPTKLTDEERCAAHAGARSQGEHLIGHLGETYQCAPWDDADEIADNTNCYMADSKDRDACVAAFKAAVGGQAEFRRCTDVAHASLRECQHEHFKIFSKRVLSHLNANEGHIVGGYRWFDSKKARDKRKSKSDTDSID